VTEPVSGTDALAPPTPFSALLFDCDGTLVNTLPACERARERTGGVPLIDAGKWLAAGAFAVGIGSDLAAPGDIAARVREALNS